MTDSKAAARELLVVDDEREISEMTRVILEGAGYRVRIANSGDGALAAISEAPPDLILLDINMPGMDGWELLRHLGSGQQHPGGGPKIPVVIFSIKMHVHDKVHALQEGAYDYITKPFSPDELLARVGRIFESLEVAP